jgi:hypothetical protein
MDHRQRLEVALLDDPDLVNDYQFCSRRLTTSEESKMALKDWYVEGTDFGSCNCDWGCPCQFESRPNQGNCRGFEALDIIRGYFGKTELTGLRTAIIYAWPGPIFEGKGEMQVIIDERANAEQREALDTILRGGETQEAATHWWVWTRLGLGGRWRSVRP